MRVIAGSRRSLPLKSVPGSDTRPTTDRIKETLFNMLQPQIEGVRFLDLFAGSGQMAIEALSRGARRATLVDADQRAITCIRQNVKSCGFADQATVLKSDAVSFLQRTTELFDIAFLDPPYRHEILQQILPILAEKMQKNGIIVCEHEPECKLPETILEYHLQKQKKYGKIMISVFRNPEEETE